jgi:hypothetical protein
VRVTGFEPPRVSSKDVSLPAGWGVKILAKHGAGSEKVGLGVEK